MSDNDVTDEALAKAAEAAGLTKFLAHDRDGLARASAAAVGYRSRRVVVTDPKLEPAHVYRPEAEADREQGESS